jgi:hypothetical protein
MTTRLALTLGPLLAAARDGAPGGSAGPTVGTRDAVDANRRKFEETVGADYTIEFQRGCYSRDEDAWKVRITVRDGAIVAVVRVSDGAPMPEDTWAHRYLSVAQVFDALESALAGDGAVRVTYDATFGFPREVHLDEAEPLADDEPTFGLDAVLIS